MFDLASGSLGPWTCNEVLERREGGSALLLCLLGLPVLRQALREAQPCASSLEGADVGLERAPTSTRTSAPPRAPRSSNPRQRALAASADIRPARFASASKTVNSSRASSWRPSRMYASIRSGDTCGVTAASDQPWSRCRPTIASRRGMAARGRSFPSSSNPSARPARSSCEPVPSRLAMPSAAATWLRQSSSRPWTAVQPASGCRERGPRRRSDRFREPVESLRRAHWQPSSTGRIPARDPQDG